MIKNLYLKILAFLCNSLPFFLEYTRNHNTKGKGQICKYLKLKNELLAECNGIKYSLNLRDDVQQQIYMNVYEKFNVKFILSLLRQGYTFLDAGANVGAYTLQVAKKLGSGDNIYSFEPEPDNFKRLDYNCKLNPFSKTVNRYQVALTNYNGTAALHKSEDFHSGWHSLTEFKDISIGKIEVSAVTLDSFIEKLGINKIDLVKIDVEANEFELLEGAENCLKEKIFTKIFIEFNGSRLAEKDKTFKDFIDLFEKYKYYPQRINLEMARKLLNGTLKQEKICENFLFELIL